MTVAALAAGRRLMPAEGRARREAMKTVALATGLADKAVALFYEKALHAQASRAWVERCTGQIAGTLAALEADRAGRDGEYWLGGRISHADIAAACALRHADESHPGLIDWNRHPALAGHCRRMEAMPAFREISQPFVPPA